MSSACNYTTVILFYPYLNPMLPDPKGLHVYSVYTSTRAQIKNLCKAKKMDEEENNFYTIGIVWKLFYAKSLWTKSLLDKEKELWWLG